LPNTGYFFDTIIRQEPFDEDNPDPADNLEEFRVMSEQDLQYWRDEAARLRGSERAVVTHLNGTFLCDIAMTPAPFITNHRGHTRRDRMAYGHTAVNQEHVDEVFARQSEIAIGNLELLHEAACGVLDVVVVCGTDFGTQESSFRATDTYDRLWLPRYRRMNDWIHQHTNWKTFKRTCGAAGEFIPHFIDSGFDILSPVQRSARGMDAEIIKAKHGDRLTFWGGGVNTQQTLPFGTPGKVRAEVTRRCEVFSKGGGFVFNSIHNIRALTPVANVVAMADAIRDLNANPCFTHG
jgi:Uroporphyrinogen decarboxylase (URO-D)